MSSKTPDMNELRPSLESVQEYHINILEKWGEEHYTFSGVPVIQMFTYEFLQMINNMYLGSVISDE